MYYSVAPRYYHIIFCSLPRIRRQRLIDCSNYSTFSLRLSKPCRPRTKELAPAATQPLSFSYTFQHLSIRLWRHLLCQPSLLFSFPFVKQWCPLLRFWLCLVMFLSSVFSRLCSHCMRWLICLRHTPSMFVFPSSTGCWYCSSSSLAWVRCGQPRGWFQFCVSNCTLFYRLLCTADLSVQNSLSSLFL